MVSAGKCVHFGTRVLRSVSEIEELRDFWSSQQQHPQADIDFYLLLHSTLSTFQPYIIVLYRNSAPEAMVIGRIEDSTLDVKLGYAKILSPKIRVLSIMYQGVLGNLSHENCIAMTAEISGALQRGEAEAAVFTFVRTDSSMYQIAAKSPRGLRRDYCLAPQTHRSMTLPPDLQSLRARFSAKVRKNHRWQANKLLQDHAGNVQIRCFQEQRELDELFRDAEEVARKTYQRGLGVGFADNPSMRQRLVFAANSGTLRAYVLYVAGRPSAFWIGTLYKHTFFSNLMGYDPDLSRYSPGMFLILNVIEGFCGGAGKDRPELIDFGLGDAQYKSLLGDDEWTEASVHLFGPQFRSLVLNAVRTPVSLLDSWLKRSLGRSGLLSRVKRGWRRQVIQ